MKNIVLHGLTIPKISTIYAQKIIESLYSRNYSIFTTPVFKKRNSHLLKAIEISDTNRQYDCYFSLGGDGTFLETLEMVGNSEIPILGINMGRLGFLSAVATEHIEESLEKYFKQEYSVEKRTMLELHSNSKLFGEKNFALNECAILRKDSSTMIQVKCFVNEEFINTYWADGVMISTPTGSTGYSLSCGGPLMMPNAKDLVITPVSPHNLNVRPLIISDNSQVRFSIKTRDSSYLVSLDSRSSTITGDEHLIVKKAPFYAKTLRLHGLNFPDTIRNKLGWGFDQRN